VRIDVAASGEAGPATVPNLRCTPWTFQPSILIFSTPGCWQITGTAGGKTLQFTLSIPIGHRRTGRRARHLRVGGRRPAQDKPQVYRQATASQPRLVREIKPHYTPSHGRENQGSVWLEIVVLDTGDVGDVVRSLDSTYGLDQQAIDAVSQWTWKPGTKDGKPVAVTVTIEVEMSFTLK
jgi:TonB family protein